MKKLTNKLLETREFPRYIGTIDDTYTELAELNDIARIISTKKSYFSVNLQTVRNQKYCFQNVVIQWPVNVHDPHIFFNSSQ